MRRSRIALVALALVACNRESASPSSSVPGSVAASSTTRSLPSFRGFLQAQGSEIAKATVEVDANEKVSIRLEPSGAGAKAWVTNPEGARVAEASAVADRSPGTRIELESPKPGAYQVELAAGDRRASLIYEFTFANGKHVELALDPWTAKPDGVVRVRARLVDAGGNLLRGDGTAVAVDVRGPRSRRETLQLSDDGAHGDEIAGDGTFGGEVTKLREEGVYFVNVDLQSSGTARSADTSFVVSPGAARFVGPVRERLLEKDASGRYAGLSIEQEVEFCGAGHYTFLAELKDRHGELVAPLQKEFDNSERTVTLTIELEARGEWIARHAIDGPWVVSGIQILREGKAVVTVATEEDHPTAPYVASTFRTPPPPGPAMLLPGRGAVEGGYLVIVTGVQLADATEVVVEGRSVVPHVNGNTSIDFTMPAAPSSALADPSRITTDASGRKVLPVDVIVRTRWGECKASEGFRYQL